MPKFNNLPDLLSFRKELRNSLTPAEAKLWTYLKTNNLEGRKFRRQHSIGQYILDFYCASEKLAIELDGEDHFTRFRHLYDQERDAFIMQFKIKVIRFENKLIFQNSNFVLKKITSEFGWNKREITL
mgnify:CR=1 FL=1|jgi:very-short-patch-repair endonuclease